MEFVNRNGAICAIRSGKTIAYIEKNYIGSHWHSAGWSHYIWNEGMGRFIYAGAIQVQHLDLPQVFRNIKQFKEFYVEYLGSDCVKRFV